MNKMTNEAAIRRESALLRADFAEENMAAGDRRESRDFVLAVAATERAGFGFTLSHN